MVSPPAGEAHCTDTFGFLVLIKFLGALPLTLSVHASNNPFADRAAAHTGVALASVALCFFMYLCHAYAPKLIEAVSTSTAHGVLRVIAFILMCLGVPIAWNGLSTLLARNVHS